MDTSQKPDSPLQRLAGKELKVEKGRLKIVDEPVGERLSHKKRNLVMLAVCGVLLLVVISWVLAGFYLQRFQLGGAHMLARQSDAVLKRQIEQQTGSYALPIQDPNGAIKQYSLQDMGMNINVDTSIQRVRQTEQQFAHRVLWWRPIPIYLSISPDSTKLHNFIANHATVTVQPAQDATLAIKGSDVVLTDGTSGKSYGLVEPDNTLETIASTLNAAPLKLQLLATNPAITSKQLAPYQTKLKGIINQSVNFAIGNQTVKANPSDIASWIELSAQNGGKSIDITVNSGKVLGYINKLAASSVHSPKAQVEVTNSDGSTTVLVSGQNGTDITDKSKIATDVTNNLLKGSAIQETLAVSTSGYKTIQAQAYDKWIEVDTTNKRMYAYEKTNLVKTFLVSAGAPRTPTVTGQYAIYSKFVQQDMRGENVDGSSYFQPHVPWINYFYKDYAIHGNYWRPLSYFGNINSSHGCVGVTPDDGQWVYDWAPIGTPVIVHT